ncbi:MAG: hypothetical protein KME18_16795 [Phormidium tanganyikae FI6-MK23]|jgi:hypothetical protein|nr:hypothetical protein [Phormidium tanganyikae FI6-MK23]
MVKNQKPNALCIFGSIAVAGSIMIAGGAVATGYKGLIDIRFNFGSNGGQITIDGRPDTRLPSLPPKPLLPPDQM